ncbi:GrdX family protein [Clostridia bacterium]|nr:GrdX family protein [Clostridia bacterium]
MRTKVFVLTNNPKAKKQYPGAHFIDGEFIDVIKEARDLIHKGHKLITHPLSGSVKPKETKYKSILMTVEAGELDMQSLHLIDNAITTTNKFEEKKHKWPDPERIMDDFQTIDVSLLNSGVEGLNASIYELV